MGKKQTNPTFANAQELAGFLHRDRGYVHRLRRRSDWPPNVSRDPPWTEDDAKIIYEWSHRRVVARAETAHVRDEQIALIQAKRRKLQIESQILRRKWIPREKVQEDMLRKLGAVRSGLLGLPRHAAAELVGKTDIGEIENILAQRVRDLLYQFAGETGVNGDGVRNGTPCGQQ